MTTMILIAEPARRAPYAVHTLRAYATSADYDANRPAVVLFSNDAAEVTFYRNRLRADYAYFRWTIGE